MPPKPDTVAEHAEVELKFLVPAERRAALAAALSVRGTAQRVALVDSYFDTPDDRLARAGLAWRVRREGRRWIQGLKSAGPGALERFEHEVPCPEGRPDPQAHAETAPGQRLLALIEQARLDGQAVGLCFQLQQRRLKRRVRTHGAVVDLALDEGRWVAGTTVQPLREIEFELVSGSVPAMLALVERWRHRFGLVYDPRHKAERGFALAAGSAELPLRKSQPPRHAEDADAVEALGAVLDECLAHISRNAIELAGGDTDLRAEQVHQLRVGIRRLRSAMRAYRGWVAAPPEALVDGLRRLFAELGRAREQDVLSGGVAAALARAGAPPLNLAMAPGPAIDLPALIRGEDTQRLLLAWIAWRAGLQPLDVAQGPLKRLARRRLRHWHARLADTCRRYDELDAPALHALRKQVKRQRYALEFFAPLLPRKDAARHLQVLSATQQALGEINDLAVARQHYQGLVTNDPAAWFAVGWLTARLAQAREQARDTLGRLAAVEPLGR